VNDGALTSTDLWDDYWEGTSLPAEISRGSSLYLDSILGTLDSILTYDSSKSLLEIGGAPGGYSIYFHRQFGFAINILDYSPRGCQLARENLELVGVPGRVYEGDLFDAHASLPRFDVVLSLGLIEHFADLTAVVEAHARYVKPGGVLIIGCPNFRGINEFILRRLSPALLDEVRLSTMATSNWTFSGPLGLTELCVAYRGGFEPLMYWRCESRRIRDRVLWKLLALLGRLTNLRLLVPLRRLNNERWSGYVLGVYRIPNAN
jgi:2-polyprenyl-3-methyl-5-hydroxy-6-metoxy-1,4-benzoquinol methylase